MARTEANLLTRALWLLRCAQRPSPAPRTRTCTPSCTGRAPATGQPLLLVMGLGLSGGAWWRTVDTLSRGFRVITFDNRGVGRSRGLTPAYTTEALADDAAAVLDALEIEQANVYGLSLGGMVAQQIALRHPRRVRSLVLGATTPAAAAPRQPTRRSWPSSTAARTGRARRRPGRRWPTTTAAAAATSTPTASPRTSATASPTRSTRRPTGPS